MQDDSDSPAIVWLRQDLRLDDNPALAAAAARGGPVIPVYILDEDPESSPLGGASRWWLNRSLEALAGELARRGSRLILRRGPAAEVLRALLAETGAGAVFWNRLYDRQAIARNRGIKAELTEAGVEVRSFNAALLNEPWEIRNGAGLPYRVFTPYWRAARALVAEGPPPALPARLCAPDAWPAADDLAAWGLHPANPNWSQGFSIWTPGESGAHAALDRFIEGPLARYAGDRNRPDVEGCSRLSPHLHFGEIGPRQIWWAMQSARDQGQGSDSQIDSFLSEIGWREFNHHILFHWPDLPERNLKAPFDAFPWRDDAAGFTAWTLGRTGYPIVDAGMRELWATGFMHNRVRMIVASFLIKDLMIDWRRGERWFGDTLVDADIAQNAANWQWVAGSGADASPWFRIFNPVSQGQKFDPHGVYVRRWVPELAGLPDAVVHAPWTAPGPVLARAGVDLGQSYPHPIVDHALARRRALAAFADLKQRALTGVPEESE
ncbi:MAG: deoxyribodipyrimidine photo-lyase [Caulobacter sp.]|nr:deoxyribodipyrimidine photo-lyase [Caulobacter sp.]